MPKSILPIPNASPAAPSSSTTDQYPTAAPQVAPGSNLVQAVTQTGIPVRHSVPSTTSEPVANNWSPSLQHLLDQPPANFPHQLLLGGMLFCFAFGVWAWLGKIEEISHVRGQLIPQAKVYKINPVESGKVARISVKKGDTIKAGQVLVELDAQIAASEVERLQQLLTAYQIELSQKQGLINKAHLEANSRAAIAAADIQAQEAAIAAAKAKVATTRELLRYFEAAKVASQARLKSLQPLTIISQQRLKELQVDVAAEQTRIAKLKPLVETGAIASVHLLTAEQALRDRTAAITQSELQADASTQEILFAAEQAVRDRALAISQHQGELQQALAEVQRLQAELSQKQAEASITQLATQHQQLGVEITQLKANMADTQNLLDIAKAKLQQRFIYAPVDGVVATLNIRNPGEIIQPGKTIAEIIPQDIPIILSASLPNQEASLIETGMSVQVKLDAYPNQNLVNLTGIVTSILPDTKQEQRYQVEVALNRSYMSANHQNIKFKSDQLATADIIIRNRRRIADVLFEPIKQLQANGINL